MAASPTGDPDVVDASDSHRYEIRDNGDLAGYAAYKVQGQTMVFIHTEIDERFEGRGLGSRLATAALDDARLKGFTVVPLCPFIARFVDRHPQYADLVAQQSP